MSVKKYAQFVSEQMKHNSFRSVKVITEDKEYGTGVDYDEHLHDKLHADNGPVAHAYKNEYHPKKNPNGYKINHTSQHGDHTDADGEPTKAHKNPDITMHHDAETEAEHGYVVHKNGKAANDPKLHVKDLHNRLGE